MCVPVGVKPLRPVGPALLQGGAVPSRRFCYTLILALLRMPVTYLAIVRQECRTSYKNRLSWNACENRQIVPFWLIFVTRLLRNPAQIEDFRAIFLHKTGLLCNVLSASFTFWAVRREISGPESEIPSPGILFSGLGIFISGLGWKNPGTETFSRRLRGRFSFPLELFPEHASRVILSAESPGGLSRRSGFCAGSVPCPIKGTGLEGIPRNFDSRMARVAAFFPRSPGPAAEYANLRRRK